MRANPGRSVQALRHLACGLLGAVVLLTGGLPSAVILASIAAPAATQVSVTLNPTM